MEGLDHSAVRNQRPEKSSIDAALDPTVKTAMWRSFSYARKGAKSWPNT